MNLKLIGALVLVLAAAPLQAQSGAELLQKAIFAQETEGNLDNAIQTYRQIVGGGYTRDVAAQAQYRLAQALLQKGDLTNAATEFQRLARDYSDYRSLVSNMAGQARRGVARMEVPAIGSEEMRKIEDRTKAVMASLQAATFEDAKSAIEITGVVAQVMFVNPLSLIHIETTDAYREKYVFGMMSPNTLLRQGFTRDSLRIGQKVTISGVLTHEATLPTQGEFVGKANLIRGENGAVVWDRNTPLGAQLTGPLGTPQAK